MKRPGSQELLPSLKKRPSVFTDVLEWLTNPVQGSVVLPATGLLVMGLDWLLFPKEVVTLGLATPLTAIIGFAAGAMGAYHLQRRFGGDSHSSALVKALVAGFLVGVPFPLAGTMVGAWVLATSGLADWKSRLRKHGMSSK